MLIRQAYRQFIDPVVIGDLVGVSGTRTENPHFGMRVANATSSDYATTCPRITPGKSRRTSIQVNALSNMLLCYDAEVSWLQILLSSTSNLEGIANIYNISAKPDATCYIYQENIIRI